MPANIVRALQSFVGGVGKDTHYITEGDLFAADDPIVKKHGALFGPVTLRASSPAVEEATAAPGEKRTITSRVKARVKSKSPAAKAKADQKAIEADPAYSASPEPDYAPAPTTDFSWTSGSTYEPKDE